MNGEDLNLAANDARALARLDDWLGERSAHERVAWAMEHVPGRLVMASSFGVQAAVALHLITRQQPDLPVILIDTGYLFPETYRFADELAERLSLNLQVIAPAISPGWMEARHGALWEQGRQGLAQYNQLRKVEPMQRALSDLGASGWFAGLRRIQSRSRAVIPYLQHRNGRWKFHPLADWTDRDVGMYLKKHDLPYHPLWSQGYVSVGDIHTTRRLEPGMAAEDTRFFGLHRECGLHERV